MNFPRYPDYKDSGIEWLDEVPGHWEVLPLKRDLAFLTSGSRGWAEHYSDDGALFIRIGNLTRDGIHLDLSDIQRVEVPDGAEGERTKVVAGDVLFSITAYLGSVAVVPEGLETAYVSQHVALARLHQRRFIPEWVGYVTRSYVGETYLGTQGYGGTKVQLSLDDVANLLVTAPPPSEQSAIAAFLDRETGKIDALVAEQEKLIELLKEKRQAIISHAVTKGLDQSVPMKDSGIEWLGEVPAHWEVKKLKHLVREGDGIQMGPFGGMLLDLETEDTGFRVYGQQNTISGDFSQGDRWISEPRYRELERYRLDPGDIVLTRKGSLGNARFVPAGVSPGIIDSDTIRLRLDKAKAKSEYVSFLFHQCPYIEEQIALMKRGAILSGINSETIANIIVALPPRDEQDRLDVGIFTKTGVIDTLTAEAQRAIELLKEHRSALISAAVTGKIDVRGLVPVREAAA